MYVVQQQQEKDDVQTIAERKGDRYHSRLEQTKWGRGGRQRGTLPREQKWQREKDTHIKRKRKREKDVTWSDNRGILFLHRDGDRVTVGHFRSNYLCAAPSAATRLLHAPRPIGGDVTQNQSLTKIKQLQTLYYIPPPFILPLAKSFSDLVLENIYKSFIANNSGNRLGQVRVSMIIYTRFGWMFFSWV